MLSVLSCTCSVSHWSHPKESVWIMSYSFLQQKVSWNHITNAVQTHFYPKTSGEAPQDLSKKAGGIIFCHMATPKPGGPFTSHSEDYWSWSEFVAARLHSSLCRFHWNYLPKTYFTSFVKSQVPSAGNGCWVLHKAQQKLVRKDPTIREGIAEVEAAEP